MCYLTTRGAAAHRPRIRLSTVNKFFHVKRIKGNDLLYNIITIKGLLDQEAILLSSNDDENRRCGVGRAYYEDFDEINNFRTIINFISKL